MSESPSTAALVSLIDRKNDLLKRIYQLVDTQCQSIKERKVAELMPLLASKQTLLDELNQLERELDPYRKEDPDSREWSSDEARDECRIRVEENRSLLNEILSKEKDCETQLVEQREQTANKLDENLNAANAAKTYQPIQQPKRGSLDLSSEA